ncbi:MAG: nucleotide exchange factor GrpE [Fulvimarina manganoxydans]|uniref:nucleotide exchange factor GrpE n=1 Tax=Fulvimarina manganoxydans TaxID=937218 RepID=UPI0023535829|nr:nucleotide exchange factor GrpE [Fulvimarina manganoxydans]MCK5931078.1 nucleotide exchange factor GrpE [Fulvimarina manganoxydans]
MTSETGKRDFEAPETEAETELPEDFDTTGFDANVDTSGFAGDAGSAADAERIAELEAENADVKDRLLRLAADMENLRRRTEREVKDARTYAVTSFAREMLSVADNLRRAIDAVPDEARESGDSGMTSLIEGVEMTERGLLASLEKNGVKKLEPEGQKFDPNFHQAMFEVPNPNVPANTVVQVVQAGYAIGDRVLRPAMVGVAKGGPKQGADRSKQPAANQDGEAGDAA